jgi:hypothetical protein
MKRTNAGAVVARKRMGARPHFEGVPLYATDDPSILPYTELVYRLAKFPAEQFAARRGEKQPRAVPTRYAIAKEAGLDIDTIRRVAEGELVSLGRQRRAALSRVLMAIETGELSWQVFGAKGLYGRLVRQAPTRPPDMRFRLRLDGVSNGRGVTLATGDPPLARRQMPPIRDFVLPKGR